MRVAYRLGGTQNIRHSTQNAEAGSVVLRSLFEPRPPAAIPRSIVHGPLFMVVLALALCPCIHARLQVNGLFTDHMVLQQAMPVPVWGQTAPGKSVAVTFAGQSHESTADAKGWWSLRLEPLQPSSDGQTLTIKGDGQTITLTDVVVGEVWVGSGQSNMAYTMTQTEDGKAALPEATHPLIRVFKRPRGRKVRESWHPCSPDILRDFSAVAYFFGRNMHEHRNVPVGLIVRAVGGTTIQRWVPAQASRQNTFIAERLQDAARRKDEFAKYEAEKGKYDKRNKPDTETGKWLAEMGRLTFYHGAGYGGLYRRMIKPLQPYAIRGVVWYQGEFNNRPGQAHDYREWQETLVNSWRSDWGQGEFPFLFVQMQVLGNATTALLRESQATTLKRCANCAMAVICDQSSGLHPSRKKIAGDRLARAARSLIDGDRETVGGPRFREAGIEGHRMVLTFDHVGKGLEASDSLLTGFFICGEDRRFQPAKAEIKGGEQVVVWHDEIQTPVATRYAWLNDPREHMPLLDSAGLPASPFRTDDWPDTAGLDSLVKRSRKPKGKAPRAKPVGKRTKK